MKQIILLLLVSFVATWTQAKDFDRFPGMSQPTEYSIGTTKIYDQRGCIKRIAELREPEILSSAWDGECSADNKEEIGTGTFKQISYRRNGTVEVAEYVTFSNSQLLKPDFADPRSTEPVYLLNLPNDIDESFQYQIIQATTFRSADGKKYTTQRNPTIPQEVRSFFKNIHQNVEFYKSDEERKEYLAQYVSKKGTVAADNTKVKAEPNNFSVESVFKGVVTVLGAVAQVKLDHDRDKEKRSLQSQITASTQNADFYNADKARNRLNSIVTAQVNERQIANQRGEADAISTDLDHDAKNSGERVQYFGKCAVRIQQADTTAGESSYAQERRHRTNDKYDNSDTSPLKWLCSFPGVEGTCIASQRGAICSEGSELKKNSITMFHDRFVGSSADTTSYSYVCPQGSRPPKNMPVDVENGRYIIPNMDAFNCEWK